MQCKLCPQDKPAIYIGETSRNLYTLCKEHLEKYVGGSKMEKSFIYKHQADIHSGREAQFSAFGGLIISSSPNMSSDTFA